MLISSYLLCSFRLIQGGIDGITEGGVRKWAEDCISECVSLILKFPGNAVIDEDKIDIAGNGGRIGMNTFQKKIQRGIISFPGTVDHSIRRSDI